MGCLDEILKRLDEFNDENNKYFRIIYKVSCGGFSLAAAV